MTVEAGSAIRSCGEWNDDRIEIIIDHSTILADDRIGSLRGTVRLMSESGHSPRNPKRNKPRPSNAHGLEPTLTRANASSGADSDHVSAEQHSQG